MTDTNDDIGLVNEGICPRHREPDGRREGLWMVPQVRRRLLNHAGRGEGPHPTDTPRYMAASKSERMNDQTRRTRSVWEDGKRQRRRATAVYEEGRRVHAWKLLHDVYVGVQGRFDLYWQKATQ